MNRKLFLSGLLFPFILSGSIFKRKPKHKYWIIKETTKELSSGLITRKTSYYYSSFEKANNLYMTLKEIQKYYSAATESDNRIQTFELYQGNE